jgi:histidine ammonia-lyase
MTITISGAGLTIADIAAVANGAPVALFTDADVLRQIRAFMARDVHEPQQNFGALES